MHSTEVRSPSPARGNERPIDRSRVTVILPTYNRAERLRRCLDALLACDLAGTEVRLRVVDDGSPDETADVVRECASAAPPGLHIEYVRQENQGCCPARNSGLGGAATDLLLFIDDDCIPEQGWIQGLVQAPWEDGLGAVGGTIVSPEAGNVVERYCRFLHYDEFPPPRQEGKITYVNTANCAFLRKALEQAGGFEPALSGGGPDIDLSWRVARLGYGLAHAPDAVVKHRHRETEADLARTFRLHGARRTLRHYHWGIEPPPTWGTLLSEGCGWLAGHSRLLLLPLNERKFVRRGASPEDARAFAYLDWVRVSAMRRGKIDMLWDVLRGRQSLERLFPLPPEK